MSLRLIGPALVAVVLALSLAACGSDEDDGDITTDRLDPVPGLTVEVSPPRAEPGETVEALIRNGSDQEIVYGAGYTLEREQDGTFVPVPLPAEPIRDVGLVALPGQPGPTVEVTIPEDAEPGSYRVILDERATPAELEVG